MKDEREIAQLHRKNWDQLGGRPKGAGSFHIHRKLIKSWEHWPS